MTRTLFAFLLIVPLLSACDVFGGSDDEPFPGCIDPTALNFLPSAEIDDGSCFYQGVVSFYVTSEANGPVDIFINDQFTGTLDGFWSGQPGSCDQPFTVTITGLTNAPRFKWTAVAGDGTVSGGEAFFVRGCSFIRVF